jgi:hypothetical protein
MPLYRLEEGSGLIAALLKVQRQTNLRYATVAERAAQLPTPLLMDITAIEATRAVEYWDGNAWQPLAGDTSALAARVTTLEGQMSALTARVTALEARPTAPIWNGGVTNIITGTEGNASIAHGLGTTPRAVVAVAAYQVLGGGAITDVCDIDGTNASTFGVRMANNHGDFLNSASLWVWWLAMA